MNTTNGSISVMFSATADGELLPPYVRAQHLMNTWTEGGPKGARYNRSKSGWFDTVTSNDVFVTVVLPWAERRTGRSVLIGDNLSHHSNDEVLKECTANDIAFICLPQNST